MTFQTSLLGEEEDERKASFQWLYAENSGFYGSLVPDFLISANGLDCLLQAVLILLDPKLDPTPWEDMGLITR